MYRLLALFIGYLIGMIQMAYLIGKLKGIDIREHGSKNAGMTNVTRTIGKKWGAFVFAFDMLKCVGAFLLASWIFGGYNWFFVPSNMQASRGILELGILPGMYAAIGAILGHCFPAWLKFRGGKGVSCALMLVLMIDWPVALAAFIIGVIPFIITRYISLGSLIYTFVAIPAMIFFGHNLEAIILMTGVTTLIWFLHRENIKHLLNGTERKFLSKKTT
jgi:glycerol-3-phosphate acyltransferase PlsY